MPPISSTPQITHTHATGLHRRELLQIGYSGLLGVGLTSVLGQRNPFGVRTAQGESTQFPASGTPKSVLIVFMTGAASQLETFDLKPNAPVEIRGEFQPIATTVPGMQLCEHLPQLAAHADKFALLRTISHGDNNHLMSTHHVLTGHVQPGAFFDKVASRDDWPCYSAGLSYLRPRTDGLPSGINLPTFLREGPLTWPGQQAGFLGPRYDPWQITADPQHPDFKVDSLTLAGGMNVERLDHRRVLLEQLNRHQQRVEEVAATRRLSHEQQLAFSMLTSSGLASAFQLSQETDSVRDRYGRHTTGQSLLLARRLVEAGVPVVQANLGHVQNWDSHGQIFTTMKDRLLPPLDQAMSALLEDLSDRGLLETTFVLLIGEFGRTPKINGDKGRDHWGACFSALFAGGGVQGGQVIGRSDESAAYPLTQAYSPDDIGATVYHQLGLAPEAEVQDRLGRPTRLNSGEIIEPLFTGRSS